VCDALSGPSSHVPWAGMVHLEHCTVYAVTCGAWTGVRPKVPRMVQSSCGLILNRTNNWICSNSIINIQLS